MTHLIVSDGAANNPVPRYRGIGNALTSIVRTEGFGSLYRGVLVYWMSTSVANASFFAMYSRPMLHGKVLVHEEEAEIRGESVNPEGVPGVGTRGDIYCGGDPSVLDAEDPADSPSQSLQAG